MNEMVIADETRRLQYRLEARRVAQNSFDQELVFKLVADKYLEPAANTHLFGSRKP